jgi:hypothetical protein
MRLARETSKSEIVRDEDGDKAKRKATQARGSREREREIERRGEGGRRLGLAFWVLWEYCSCVKKKMRGCEVSNRLEKI